MNFDEIINQVAHPEEITNEFYPEDIQANKAAAVLAGIPVLFWIPLVLAQDSAYGKFCANQGLTMLAVSAVLGFAKGILSVFLGLIPILGGIANMIIGLICFLISAGGVLLLIVSAAEGKARKLPLVGDWIRAFR